MWNRSYVFTQPSYGAIVYSHVHIIQINTNAEIYILRWHVTSTHMLVFAASNYVCKSS